MKFYENFNTYFRKLEEDTVKTSDGKWTNKGDSGETHGKFATKKAADAQRKAMFANGYSEQLTEDLAAYIQKIHDEDEYLWNLHGTDYTWLYDECAKYSDGFGSEGCEDSIADCVRRMPKQKQYEIIDRLVEPLHESADKKFITKSDVEAAKWLIRKARHATEGQIRAAQQLIKDYKAQEAERFPDKYQKEEALDDNNSRYIQREMYNAISDVIYDYKDLGLTREEIRNIVDDATSTIIKKFKEQKK